jgi:hypothetical protein
MDKNNTGRAESSNTASPDTESKAANDLSSLSFSSEARNEVARQEAVLETVISKGNEILIFPWKGGHSAQTEPEALGDSVALSQETKEDSVAGALFFGPTTREFKLGEPTFAEGPETIAEFDIAGPSGRNSYSGNLSNENDVLGRDAGQSVETTGTFRL